MGAGKDWAEYNPTSCCFKAFCMPFGRQVCPRASISDAVRRLMVSGLKFLGKGKVGAGRVCGVTWVLEWLFCHCDTVIFNLRCMSLITRPDVRLAISSSTLSFHIFCCNSAGRSQNWVKVFGVWEILDIVGFISSFSRC